jgi:8-oxo-dGTP diphosphatase
MLYRNKPPNQHRWNGLGGKIQVGETPLVCVQREILEEANIDLNKAPLLRFAGIVTWPVGADSTASSSGMYAFIVDLPTDWPTSEGVGMIPEGILCWKPIEWVCNPQNIEVASNIPHFLPHMLSERVPAEYFCDYHEEYLASVTIRPLSTSDVQNTEWQV